MGGGVVFWNYSIGRVPLSRVVLIACDPVEANKKDKVIHEINVKIDDSTIDVDDSRIEIDVDDSRIEIYRNNFITVETNDSDGIRNGFGIGIDDRINENCTEIDANGTKIDDDANGTEMDDHAIGSDDSVYSRNKSTNVKTDDSTEIDDSDVGTDNVGIDDCALEIDDSGTRRCTNNFIAVENDDSHGIPKSDEYNGIDDNNVGTVAKNTGSDNTGIDDRTFVDIGNKDDTGSDHDGSDIDFIDVGNQDDNKNNNNNCNRMD